VPGRDEATRQIVGVLLHAADAVLRDVRRDDADA
jgi:hypothetical protein